MLAERRILEHTLSVAERRVLEEVTARIRDHWRGGVERIAVFGSRARGDSDDESDIDLLVVLKIPKDEEWRASDEVWRLLLEAMRTDGFVYAPIAPCVMSQERFEQMRAAERRFAVDIDAEAISL